MQYLGLALNGLGTDVLGNWMVWIFAGLGWILWLRAIYSHPRQVEEVTPLNNLMPSALSVATDIVGNDLRVSHNLSAKNDPGRNIDSHQLSTIIDNTLDGLLVIDLNGQVVFANRAAETLFGLGVEELIGRDFGIPFVTDGRTEIYLRHADNHMVVTEMSVVNSDWLGQPAYLAALRDVTERLEAETALKQSEEQFRLMFELAPIGMALADPDGLFIKANQSLCNMLGYTEAELKSLSLTEITASEDLSMVRAFMRQLRAGDLSSGQLEHRHLTKQGTYLHTLHHTTLLRDEQNNPLQWVSQFVDITDRKQAEAALQIQEEQYRRIVETSAEGIWVLDQQGVVQFANQQIAVMLGYPLETLQDTSVFQFVHQHDIPLLQDKLAARRQGVQERYDFRFRRYDGSDLWVIVSETPLVDDKGNYIGVLGMITDITERKLAEEQIRHIALYDPLTDLPNRSLFLDRLGHTIRRAKRRGTGYLFAVLFLDLDRFKLVNDSLGHLAGDELLVAIARRLEACLRPSDTLARLGGDEFTVLLENLVSEADAIHIAERINQTLQHPFNLNSHEVFINTSIGIALSHNGYSYPEEFLRDADTAMYQAKALGKARYIIFNHEMHSQALERLQLENDLQRALERHELEVFYQPVVCLATGQLQGFEALMRWQHAERGLISPNIFIPIAEETGLIDALGYWILEKACRQVRTWQQQFPPYAQLTISVNLSSQQFRHPRLVQTVLDILQATGLPHDSLKLEVTESMLMENALTAAQILQQLAAKAVQISIDDFGTGYSSLSYLHRFSLHTLKIDSSFTRNLLSQTSDGEIAQTIVTLAHNLNMTVVAEGIENVAQMKKLRHMGCEYGQGFLFSPGLEASSIESLLANQTVWSVRGTCPIP